MPTLLNMPVASVDVCLWGYTQRKNVTINLTH
jgi:hypothetical protein